MTKKTVDDEIRERELQAFNDARVSIAAAMARCDEAWRVLNAVNKGYFGSELDEAQAILFKADLEIRREIQRNGI